MIRKALKWGLIGFIALMVIGALLPSEETPKKEQASVNEQQPVASQKKQEKPQQKERPAALKEKMATVGQEVRAGDMLWVVNDAYYTTELPDIFGIAPPKEGNFVVVDFTLTNQRNEAVTLDQSHLILKDSTGNTYQADTDTFSFIPVEKDIFLTQINPDVAQEGRVIFSVGPDAQGFVLTLDDLELLEDAQAKVDLGTLSEPPPAASSATATASASAAAQ
jgi:hypothetical protein